MNQMEGVMNTNLGRSKVKGHYWAVLTVLICSLILFFCSLLSLLSGVRDYLYSSDVGAMFILAGIVAESLKIAGMTNASGVSLISFAMITQLLLMLITALSACIVLFGVLKDKRRTFFSYLMVIIGLLSASNGPLTGKPFIDFMIIISWVMAISSIMYIVPMRIANASYKKATKIAKKNYSINIECPRKRFLVAKVIVLIALTIVFVINTIICLKYVSGGSEAILEYLEYNVEARYKDISELDIGQGYVQTIFADVLLIRTGTYEDFYLNSAKLSLIGVVIGLVAVFSVCMLEIFMKKRKLWFACPLVFIISFLNIDVLLLKELLPNFLFLILSLFSILLACLYARIERVIQTREFLADFIQDRQSVQIPLNQTGPVGES